MTTKQLYQEYIYHSQHQDPEDRKKCDICRRYEKMVNEKDVYRDMNGRNF